MNLNILTPDIIQVVITCYCNKYVNKYIHFGSGIDNNNKQTNIETKIKTSIIFVDRSSYFLIHKLIYRLEL